MTFFANDFDSSCLIISLFQQNFSYNRIGFKQIREQKSNWVVSWVDVQVDAFAASYWLVLSFIRIRLVDSFHFCSVNYRCRKNMGWLRRLNIVPKTTFSQALPSGHWFFDIAIVSTFGFDKIGSPPVSTNANRALRFFGDQSDYWFLCSKIPEWIFKQSFPLTGHCKRWIVREILSK